MIAPEFPGPLPPVGEDTPPPTDAETHQTLDNRLDPSAPSDPENLSERREETLEKTLEKYGDDDVDSGGNSGGPIEVDPDQEKTLEKYGDEPDQEIPEIGMFPTGMIGPEFPGPLPPVGEDTPPPPGDDGGGTFDTAALGVPYQDYIPFFPMVQDPTTGQWRNAEPGEVPGLGEGGRRGPAAAGRPDTRVRAASAAHAARR